MQRGRRIAFDFGDARIGVAGSDPDSILASPIATLLTRSVTLWDEIFDLLGEYEPIKLFVGRPMHMAGHESASAVKAELFAKELSERFGLTVELIDERLSTVSAQRQLKEAGVSSKESKKSIDAMAAVAILTLAIDIEKKKSANE